MKIAQDNITITSRRPRLLQRLRCLAAGVSCSLGLCLSPAHAAYAAAPPATYVVQPGDTLSAIAQRFDTTVQTLMIINHLANANLIYSGEVLLVSSRSGAIARSTVKATGRLADLRLGTESTLGKAVAQFATARAGLISLAVIDLKNGEHLYYQPHQHFDTASIVKLAIMEALLHVSTQTEHALSQADQALMTGMIEDSDNDDATALWNQEGQAPAIQHWLGLVGATHTTANAYWGLTQTTAPDQLDLLNALISPNHLLGHAQRVYALNLMEHVIPFEDWGVSFGPAGHAQVALKNGWLPIDDDWSDWEINSVGIVRGDHRDYLIAVLTSGNPTETYGIDSIEHISKDIWEALGFAYDNPSSSSTSDPT
ncbi:MAG: LysM peptidoglycan-binding domain-containing protein [Firmicutes bacterium]|nr:LysM peptidoglycan-binding domain-containing protein [Bacillota bacterium]